jgi:hypothetical protein
MLTAETFIHRGHWRPRLLKNGLEVPAWEPPMPRIPDMVLESVFYLYPSFQAAENAEHAGGCGFFILIPFERGSNNHLYMVTNRHVIDKGGLTARINIESDKSIPFDTDDRAWFRHPNGDDLAIILVDFPITFTCKGFTLNDRNIVTPGLIQEHDIGIGDEIYTIGRYVNHDGKQRNNPVVRFGNIAQMPVEPIKQENGHLQESYLVECRSVSGYSGSPVFVYIPPWAARPKTPGKIQSQAFGPWLLGVNWGHLNDWKPVCDSSGRPLGNPPMKVGLNSGMMGVVPVWRLWEMLKHPKTIEKQRQAEKRILGDGPPIASSDSAESFPAPDDDANPNHLPDFARLVDVAARKKPKET